MAPSVPTISIHVEEKFDMRRKDPAGANREYAAVVQRNNDPNAIRDVMRRLHDFVHLLCVDAKWAFSARNTRE